ncbi:MAG: hypothetical protein ACI9N1_000287 [Flavobacteriales bacterium]|jgi:hypothetical protein
MVCMFLIKKMKYYIFILPFLFISCNENRKNYYEIRNASFIFVESEKIENTIKLKPSVSINNSTGILVKFEIDYVLSYVDGSELTLSAYEYGTKGALDSIKKIDIQKINGEPLLLNSQIKRNQNVFYIDDDGKYYDCHIVNDLNYFIKGFNKDQSDPKIKHWENSNDNSFHHEEFKKCFYFPLVGITGDVLVNFEMIGGRNIKIRQKYD